jgi:hypothetical protein
MLTEEASVTRSGHGDGNDEDELGGGGDGEVRQPGGGGDEEQARAAKIWQPGGIMDLLLPGGGSHWDEGVLFIWPPPFNPGASHEPGLKVHPLVPVPATHRD